MITAQRALLAARHQLSQLSQVSQQSTMCVAFLIHLVAGRWICNLLASPLRCGHPVSDRAVSIWRGGFLSFRPHQAPTSDTPELNRRCPCSLGHWSWDPHGRAATFPTTHTDSPRSLPGNASQLALYSLHRIPAPRGAIAASRDCDALPISSLLYLHLMRAAC
eukprot:351638-Chlamydomonas_euryale.AAC.5